MNRIPPSGIRRALPGVLAAAIYLTGSARAADFTNSASLTLPAFHSGPGAAGLYPSTINVSGLTGKVARVTVTLRDITIDRPDDLEVMLVAPDGAHLVILGDAGGVSTVAGVTITLDDMAGLNVPDAGPFTNGIYRPTSVNSSATTFPLPAPQSGYLHAAPGGSATFASAFNGIEPNGEWKLFVADDVSSGVSGTIAGGWSLSLLTSPPLYHVAAGRTNGHPFLQFNGLPGQSYYFQRATNVIGPYQDIVPAITAGAGGVIAYEDATTPTSPQRYYRVRSAP